MFILNIKIVREGSHFNNDIVMKVKGLESAKIAVKRIILIKPNGLGAKIKKNCSVAPHRKKNSIATMHQVYISGAWKTMFDQDICGQFFIIDL